MKLLRLIMLVAFSALATVLIDVMLQLPPPAVNLTHQVAERLDMSGASHPVTTPRPPIIPESATATTYAGSTSGTLTSTDHALRKGSEVRWVRSAVAVPITHEMATTSAVRSSVLPSSTAKRSPVTVCAPCPRKPWTASTMSGGTQSTATMSAAMPKVTRSAGERTRRPR